MVGVAKISLKKLISKKEISSIINSIILENPVNIYDNEGVLLFGDKNQELSYNYPISAAGLLLGTVSGTEKAGILAQILSYFAEAELEKKALAIETLEKYEEINFLYDISSKIASCRGIQEVTKLIIDEVKKLINANEVSVMLLNEESGELETILVDSLEKTRKTNLKPGLGIAGYVLLSGRAEIVNHVHSDGRFLKRNNNDIHSLICAPLKIQNKIIGVINVSNCEYIDYTSQDLKLFTALTSQAAAAIQAAKYYEKIKEYSYNLEIKVVERTLALEIANKELQRIANLDGLTQVANRRRFDEYLTQQWWSQTIEKSSISLILVDVDYFKLYNDYYGHQAGDDCLKHIAQTISNVVQQPPCLVARYGGEEFAVLMPNSTISQALAVAEDIKLEMQRLKIPHVASKNKGKYVTLSLGISNMIPREEICAQVLIAKADKALYQAKEQGRDRYILQV